MFILVWIVARFKPWSGTGLGVGAKWGRLVGVNGVRVTICVPRSFFDFFYFLMVGFLVL